MVSAIGQIQVPDLHFNLLQNPILPLPIISKTKGCEVISRTTYERVWTITLMIRPS
jgi:hypothetical protein